MKFDLLDKTDDEKEQFLARIHIICGDLAKPFLSLSEDEFNSLSLKVFILKFFLLFKLFKLSHNN